MKPTEEVKLGRRGRSKLSFLKTNHGTFTISNKRLDRGTFGMVIKASNIPQQKLEKSIPSHMQTTKDHTRQRCVGKKLHSVHKTPWGLSRYDRGGMLHNGSPISLILDSTSCFDLLDLLQRQRIPEVCPRRGYCDIPRGCFGCIGMGLTRVQ